jgi:hypothetical protein
VNVSALPPEPVGTAISALSRELLPRGGVFALDGVERRPHMTLFMARFPTTEITAVGDALHALIPRLPRVRAVHRGFLLTAGRYYEVSYERTDELLSVHRSVMRALCGFRHSPGEPVEEEYFAPYSSAQRVNARKWGYDLAEDLYRPHVTITRFRSLPSCEPPAPGGDLSFEVTRLGLFEADALGATSRLVAEFDLSR